MTYRAATTRNRVGAALAALAIGTTASIAGTAPVANASCASVFGIGNTANCTSSFGNIAIAIGSTASATASGGFFNLAWAQGTGAFAYATGILGAAISAGTNAQTGVGSGFEPIQLANIAVNLGNHSGGLNSVSASGLGNLAVNLGGTDVFVGARGALTNATNMSGSGSVADSSGFVNWAFSIGSTFTTVSAGPGAFSVAGSIRQFGTTITQKPFGININGSGFPPSATVQKAAVRNNRTASAPRAVSSPKVPSATAPKRSTAHSARG